MSQGAVDKELVTNYHFGCNFVQKYTFYNVQFRNKNTYFRVHLRKIDAPAREITYKAIAASRPYVRWAIADKRVKFTEYPKPFIRLFGGENN